ncbi:histidine kinase [Sphingomonas sp. JC676]|uniref:EF-hand domain-containing protein n=1 Tax=Sphingomonas sp. JC676 TaxID=2768065 RepID=UPI00165770E7|nr:EF-hand domain-containing protein [Sphingomonas sp. JC676]MBC9031607.1 histidine kinase [Sphingomonas sp. JC676]
MWRYFVGAGAALLLGLAGMFLFRGSASPGVKLPGAPAARAEAMMGSEAQLPAEAPSASARTREEKRFDRYDKDRNSSVTREEYLASRRKAFAKLDVNSDGKLEFEEWALKSTTKFVGADKDKSGALTRAEFVATAPAIGRGKTRPQCVCAGPGPSAAPAKEDDES